jgi:RHS repeat-associated protein
MVCERPRAPGSGLFSGSEKETRSANESFFAGIPVPPFGVFLFKKGAHRETPAGFELSRKELDQETGFYYYGARYLNPRTSMWISADPAMGDYIPSAPVDDETKKRNGNLPGMGGVFNYVNFHVYHYAGNNPVKLIDPDGRNDLANLNGFGIEIFEKTLSDLLNSLFTKEAAQTMAVMVLRDGAEVSGEVSDKATVVAIGAGAAGIAPVAIGAGKVAVVSSGVRLGLNGLADIIEGKLTNNTVASLGAVIVDRVVAAQSPIRYNAATGRFQNVNTGRFVTNRRGTLQLAKDAAITQSFSSRPPRQDIVEEALKKILEQRNANAQ